MSDRSSRSSHLEFHISEGRTMQWKSVRCGLVLSSATGLALACALASVNAQPPGRSDRNSDDGGVEASLKRLMAFDANGDGKLSKDEITDSRLAPLLQRADANQDGLVTKEELAAQLGKEAAVAQRSDRGGPPPGGPGNPGGPPGDRAPGSDRGPGGDRGAGPGGRGQGGRGGPGQVLPAFIQDELNLTEAQRRDLQELQKDVDARLAKILTAEQQQQLQQLRSRGPGSGGPGGPGGPGGFGPPPGGGPSGDGNSGRRPNRPQ
jgi:hypothetical protein